MKIAVSHYKNSDKELFVNGGSIYIDGKYLVLKSFFRKIALFNIDDVKYRKLPDELTFKALEVYDNGQSYVLLLTKPNYFKLCEIIKI